MESIVTCRPESGLAMRTQATCDALRRLLPAIRRRLQPAKEIRKRWKPRRPLFFFLSLRCRIEEKDRSL